jgi:hypothetical protein
VNPETLEKSLPHVILPESFGPLYETVKETWQAHSREILSDAYIQKTLKACFCLQPWEAQILAAAARLRENEALCLLVCLLEAWIRSGGEINGSGYVAPPGEGPEYDFLHLFPAIATMAESVAHLRSRGVPEDVIAATMGEYDFCVNMCLERQGRPMFDKGRLNWITRLIRNRLIRIDRFKYDLPGPYMSGVRVYRNSEGALAVLADGLRLHRSGRILGSVGHTDEEGAFTGEITETETAVTGFPEVEGIVKSAPVTLDKGRWQLCLTSEDTFPRIHIPSDGPFDRETVAASFARAREIFDRCYPDYPYKGFFCSTWLLSGDLKELLKPTSNILGFQSFFTPVPHRSSGGLVFSFAFGLDARIPEDLESLPERSSLHRAVKQRYLSGGYVHEGAGFFL